MKKTKLICCEDESKFEETLNEFIKDKRDCDIQYKPVFISKYLGDFMWYTALVIWEEVDCE